MISADMRWLEKRTNVWGHIKGQKVLLRVPNVDCYAATKIQLRGIQTRGQNADIYTVNLVICGWPRRCMSMAGAVEASSRVSFVKRCDMRCS